MTGGRVDDLALVRTGDKGDTLIMAVIARSPQDYPALVEALTEERVHATYSPLVTAPATRTLLPGLGALVFLLPGVLGAGVTGSPVLDGHGKTLSHHLAGLPLTPP